VKLLRACIVPAILLAAAVFAAPPANAQYVYGYSLVSLSGSTVYSWSYTELDYVSSGSYSVETDAYPNFASSAGGTGSSSALVGASGSASSGNYYWVQTNHWVIANGSDPYGFGGISANYYNEAFYAYPTGTPGAGGSFWVGTTWYTAYYGTPPSISEVDGTDYPGYAIIWGNALTDSSGDTQVSIDGSYVSLAYISASQVNAYYSGAPGYHSLSLTTPYGTAYSGFNIGLLAQAIYPFSPGNVTLGVSPFTISAFTTSGLPVTFTSNTTGVCTVSGGTVTILSGGTCSITASQAGNATYSAAANVTETFTVFVTISGQLTVNGSPVAGATMTLSGSQTGSVTTGSNGSWTLAVAAGGSYTITPTAPGYSFTPASLSFNGSVTNQIASFQLVPVPLVISASMKQGPPQMGFVINGSTLGAAQAPNSSVMIGNTLANIIGWAPNQITAQVPGGATPAMSGNLVVTVNGVPLPNLGNFTITNPFGCAQ